MPCQSLQFKSTASERNITLQCNAVQFNRTAINAVFMKLMMFNFCLDCVREALIGTYDNF